ncbi:MAG TPA: hypothetical protein VLJ42_10445 [Solirubrobacteraceae bacterium]|nr:hypothetical protein [Solirubrobacteraceae bacterium]
MQKVLDLAREEKRRVRRVDELAHAEAAQLAPQLARADVNRQLQIDRAKRNTGPREPRSELSERLIGFLNEHKRYLMGPSKDAMIAFEQSRHGVEVRNVETLRKALLRARKKILGQLAASCPTEVVPMTNGPRSTTRNPTT